MRPKSLLIRGGRVIDPSQNLDTVADVYVEDGKIKAIEKTISLTRGSAVREIDAEGLWISAGWVDIHTHLREPGFTHKETIRTGALSAAVGGFTSIACMANTNPVNDSSYVTSYIYQKAATEADINVYAIGAVTKGLAGKQLAEIGAMWESGIVGLSDDGHTVQDAYIMRKALDYSKKFDLVVITHAEDTCLKGKGVMNEGFNSTRFGLRGNPKAAEELIVARDILLTELTGARLHVAHVSTAGSVRLIREAKSKGIRVTAEVTPHHLTLTDEAVGNYDTNTKVAPPLREQMDVYALQEALADGTIDVVATDHAPHSVTEKEVEYDHAAFGMVGLETAFPLYYRLCLENKLSLNRLIASMTYLPAEIIGVPKGTLKNNADADITVFDPNAEFRIDKTSFRSKSQNTPFNGMPVQGQVCFTIASGEVVYENPDRRKGQLNE